MKNIIIGVLALALIGVGYYVYTLKSSVSTPPVVVETPEVKQPETPEVKNEPMTVIGKSAGGHDITAYHFGKGEKEVVFVGGIHGGYEWNTSLVAYELMDQLTKSPDSIPENLKVTVIPVLNPDGLSKVVEDPAARFAASDITASQTVQTSGRSNGNGVDLNRNFDCDWQAKGTWKSTPVSGGAKAFSEPEALAFKNYIEDGSPAGVVFWFSSVGGVYASNCDDSAPAGMEALLQAYAKGSGYKAYKDFTSYTVTGDATNWLAKIGVPSISVLLTDHENTEWTKNWAGVQEVLSVLSR